MLQWHAVPGGFWGSEISWVFGGVEKFFFGGGSRVVWVSSEVFGLLMNMVSIELW